MFTHLSLTAVLLAAQGPQAGTIEGVVRGYHEGQGSLLPFAVVQVTANGVQRTVVADSLGHYRITRVRAGTVRLIVSHPGHVAANMEARVPAGALLTLDVDLERRPIELDPLEVKGDPLGADPPPSASDVGPMPELEVVALAATPGFGEAGLGEAAASLPGNDPSDPSDVLFMRGSTTDVKLVLLDGAPVYTPFHLGGLLQSFDASALRGAALHVGGAPARYDGGLSYILDLRTRSPRRDRLRAGGSLDLVSGHLSLEGPLGDRVGVAATARSLHDWGSGALGSGHTPYGYQDVLGRLEATLAEGHRVTATGFWNAESVLLRTDDTVIADALARPGPDDARWGNTAGSLAYRGGVGSLTLDLGLSASEYQADLPLRPASDTGRVARGFLASADTRRVRVTLDASAPLGTSRVRFGGSVDQVRSRYSARVLSDPTAPPDASEARGTVAGGYVDGVHNIAPGLDVRAGLRADAFSTERRIRLAPRVAFLVSLGPDALLTVAVGRYHQYTRATDSDVELAVSDGVPQAVSGPLLSVATADHLVLSLDQRLRGDVRLGIEGFWKNFSGLGGPASPTLTSSGVDLRLSHRASRSTAWLGYNLSWFWSGADAVGTTSEFTGRQLLSVGLDGTLSNGTGGSFRLAYSAGLPFTSIPFGDRASPDALSIPDEAGPITQEDPAFSASSLTDGFLRVDLELFTRLEAKLGGHDMEIRPYLRLLNALDRRDALFFYFEPWRDEDLRPIAERSVLPVLGFEWRF